MGGSGASCGSGGGGRGSDAGVKGTRELSVLMGRCLGVDRVDIEEWLGACSVVWWVSGCVKRKRIFRQLGDD